jgi:hypothetical protein
VKGGWWVKGLEVPFKGRFGFCTGSVPSLSCSRPIFFDEGEAYGGIVVVLQLRAISGSLPGAYKEGIVA